jgi:flavin-dependent dehydrogenase
VGSEHIVSSRDAAIIGAGPAGTVAAVLLCRVGWDVTLIEQHRFPRDKVCGESLSALGIEVLERAGLADRIGGLGPVRIGRTALHACDGQSVSFALPRAMWGVSRRAMDFELLNAAREAGARIIQPARCESLDRGLRVRELTENRVETLHPPWILLADGKGALLPERPRATADFGVKAHFESVEGPGDAVELFGVRGHYVGLAPIEGGLFNVAMSLPARRLEKAGGDFDGLWREIVLENCNLGRRFLNARRVGEWLASPLPRFGVGRDWPLKVIPLGNAAAALEPIGGEGMGLAMRSAELAAEALNSGGDTRRLRGRFNELWRRRRAACRGLAQLLSRPALAGAVMDWASGSEMISRKVLGWMGKE